MSRCEQPGRNKWHIHQPEKEEERRLLWITAWTQFESECLESFFWVESPWKNIKPHWNRDVWGSLSAGARIIWYFTTHPVSPQTFSHLVCLYACIYLCIFLFCQHHRHLNAPMGFKTLQKINLTGGKWNKHQEKLQKKGSPLFPSLKTAGKKQWSDTMTNSQKSTTVK